MGESVECRDLLGVASSSSLESLEAVLRRDNRCNGLCPVAGVAVAIEFRLGLGVHPSVGIVLVGELRRLANLVISVGIAEMVLRSPTVSSLMVFSSPKVMSTSRVSPSSGMFSLLAFSCIVLMSSFRAVVLYTLLRELFLEPGPSCKSLIALVMPSLNLKVDCAGDSGGESMATVSSCSRYFTGDRLFGEALLFVGLRS